MKVISLMVSELKEKSKKAWRFTFFSLSLQCEIQHYTKQKLINYEKEYSIIRYAVDNAQRMCCRQQ